MSRRPASVALTREALPSDATAVTAASPLPGKTLSGAVSLTKRIQAVSRWRENYNPLRQLTLQRAVTMAENYTRGWMADLQWTYYFIEQTDEDLFALLERRMSRLLEMDFSGRPLADADKTLAAEQAAMIGEKLAKIDNLYEAIEHLASASFRGFAHCELWHDAQGDLNHLEIVDQWNAVRDGLRGGWKYNPQALQTAYFGLPDSLIMPPENFLYREVRRHINRVALFKFLRTSLAQKDWDAFVEIYGIPSGVVIGPPVVPDDKAADFKDAAREIAEGGSGFLPHGSEYEPNDKPRGNSPFRERLEYLTEKLILVGTGGMLTMLTRSGSGTLAGNAHTDAFEQIAKGEARKISECINRQIVDGWLDEAFPGKPHAAYFSLDANEETQLGEIVAHIGGLAAAGYQVDESEVTEKTGYKLKLRPLQSGSGALEPKLETGLDGRSSDPNTGDPASLENRRTIANAVHAPVDAGAAVFSRHAVRQLTEAQTAAVQPMLDRIAALKDLTPDKFAGGLETLRADLPRLFAEARLKVPGIAAVWDQVLGTALVDGLAERPTETVSNGRPVATLANADPYHDALGRFSSGEGGDVQIKDEHWTGSPKDMHRRAEALMRAFPPVKNEATGMTVHFTRDGRGKTLYSLRTAHEFQAAARALPELMRTAHPGDMEPDRKGRPSIRGFTKFHSRLHVGDSHYRAELTVKHADTGAATVHKFYLLRLHQK